MTPGPVYTQKVCVPGGCSTDPCTGLSTYIAPTTGYQQVQAAPTVTVNRVYRPNIVAEQVPQTCYVQKVVVQKVPVQVCRMVTEEQVRKVPITTCRMVQEEQVRMVPVTVCRQVCERVENKVPVQTCRMVAEEQVRKVPVQTCRMVAEEHVEQVPVQVCRMVAEEQTVRQPICVQKRIPVTYTYRVPRTVVMKVPVDPCTVRRWRCRPRSARPATSSVPYYSTPSTSASTSDRRRPRLHRHSRQSRRRTKLPAPLRR